MLPSSATVGFKLHVLMRAESTNCCSEIAFPRQKIASGHWILFANSVIVAPYDRPNRKLRGTERS
jgi:hypothetical protein